MYNLTDLANKYNSDKGPYGRSTSGHNYTKTYDKYFEPFKEKEFVLLELGVRDGVSMDIWKDYFTKAHIYGIDIVPPKNNYKNDRVDIFILDATDKKAIRETMEKIGKPEIIIDDASHKAQDIITSLYLLKEYLVPGGYYFIEDLDPNQDKEMVKTYIRGLEDMKLIEYIMSDAGYNEELVILQKL